ncbi:DCP2-domain-containing protein [Lichtheimia hyalospora FSU 10163]|nr:DCP2-domain-containing protein [Lichtheimia hyalospora FSU 10163]
MLMQTNALATASFEEILDDLSTRFIINVPEAELKSPRRICFQVEQAHWFYEDFVRLLQPNLQSFQLKTFSEKIFKHCPLLKQWAHQHERAYADFMQYRFRIPVCGAILLNENMDKCVLVKGWSSKSGWSFPRGKINQDEEYDHCAIREVMEETGYDISPLIKDTYLQCTIREQSIRLYVVCGVPEDTKFMPQTRKEISQVEWFKLDDLPGLKPGSRGRFYMVVPFVSKLKVALPIIRREQQKAKGGKQVKNKTNGHRKKNKNNVTQSDKSSSSPPSPPNDTNSAAEPSAALKSLLGISAPAAASLAATSTTTTTAATTPPNETPEPSSALKSLLGITAQQTNGPDTTTNDGTQQSDHVIEQQQQQQSESSSTHPLLALLRSADSRYNENTTPTSTAPTTPPLLSMLQRAEPNNNNNASSSSAAPSPAQQSVPSNPTENGTNGTHPLIALLQSGQQS